MTCSRKTNESNEFNVAVGTRLRQKRITLGITQEKLAADTGLTFQQIQKYEKGVNGIPLHRLVKIAQLLFVPVTYFFDAEVQTYVQEIPGTSSLSRFMLSFSTLDPDVQKRIRALVYELTGLKAEAEEAEQVHA
jgi:transcriptional regulator with XRE-family HTH domain